MSEDGIPQVKELETKIDKLFQELEHQKSKIEMLESIPELSKKIDGLQNEIGEMRKVLDDTSELDEIKKAILEKDLSPLSSKIDELSSGVEKIGSDVSSIRESKEMEVLFKKIDDVLIAVTDMNSVLESQSESQATALDEKAEGIAKATASIAENIEQLRAESGTEVLGKKIDDLQSYVAGLSSLEEKVAEIASSYAETKEIVGIIVRQLDDIERKYNKAIEELTEATESLKAIADIEGVAPVSGKGEAKVKEKATPKTKPAIDAATLDGLMNGLLKRVKPQTEAKEMATYLEEVRDKLTTMIKSHSPVFHQIGTRARELKSYPPTATLNENDIARLNKEIRDWTTKLKKSADES